MWQKLTSKNDIETGSQSQPLYPGMIEDSTLRWGFIRKVYSIIAIQLIATIIVAYIVVTYDSIPRFLNSSGFGYACYILIIIIPFIVLCPLYMYRQSHPINYLLLGIFTSAIAVAVGFTCAFTNGKVILEAVILTAVVVVSLTLYTFWAAKRGQDFNFLGPFLFGSLCVLIVFGFIQIFFPLGKIGVMIYGCVASIIFCGYIIFDTDNLIKRHSYDDYIWASIELYLDIINLFLSLLSLFRASES